MSGAALLMGSGGQISGLPAPAFDFSLTGPTLPTGAALSRTSQGTYYNASGVLVVVGNDVARFPFGGANFVLPLGLLIETASTNAVIASQDLTSSAWTKTGVSAGTLVVAPDNTTSANTMTVTASPFPSSSQTMSVTIGGHYSISGFFKFASGDTDVILELNDKINGAAQLYMNLGTGVIDTTLQSNWTISNVAIIKSANGWARLQATAVPTFTSSNVAFDFYQTVSPVGALIANPISLTVNTNSKGDVISPSVTGGVFTSPNFVTAPSHGSASTFGTNFLYTPTASFSGSDSFQYSVTGPNGTSNNATISITVGGNIVFSCSDFSTTNWAKIGSPTIGSLVADPNGNITAQQITGAASRVGFTQDFVPKAVGNFDAYIQLKAITDLNQTWYMGYYNGATPVQASNNNISQALTPSTTTWQLFGPFAFTAASTDAVTRFVFQNTQQDTGGTFATGTIAACRVQVVPASTPNPSVFLGCAIPPPPIANSITTNVTTNVLTTIAPNVTGTFTNLGVTQPSHGTSGSTTTNLSYQSVANVNGSTNFSDSFTYTATNASGTSAPAVVSLNVSTATTTGGLGYMVGLTGGGASSTQISTGENKVILRPFDMACYGFVPFNAFINTYTSSNTHRILNQVMFPPIDTGGTTNTNYTTALAGTADWTNQTLGYNSFYYKMANSIKNVSCMSVRPLHEAGGEWYSWNTQITGAQYQALFKTIARICRSIVPGIVVEFNGNLARGINSLKDGGLLFPGAFDPVNNPGGADTVSADFYTHNLSAGTTWAQVLSNSNQGGHGYQFFADLATNNGIGICMSEVACDAPSTDSPTFMQDMIAWINGRPPGVFRYFQWSPWANQDICTPGTNTNAQNQIQAAWKTTKFGGTWWKGTPLPPSDF